MIDTSPKQTKNSPATAKAIQDAFDAIAPLQVARDKAESARAQKQQQFYDERDECEALEKTLTPDDVSGIGRRSMLLARLPLYKNALPVLELAVRQAAERVNVATGRLHVALAAGVREIGEWNRVAIMQAIARLTDDEFAAWCAARAPVVTNAEFFARDVAGSQAKLNLSLHDVVRCVLGGEVPVLPPPPDPLQAAALVHTSMQPGRY